VRKAAQLRVELLAKRLAQTSVSVETHVSAHDPVSAILELTRSLPVDLVVMGTRGLTGIKHVLLGSVAERTVRLAPCPVLTVKARSV
jgi:universal stress protein A